jgi:hypothetical protein
MNGSGSGLYGGIANESVQFVKITRQSDVNGTRLAQRCSAQLGITHQRPRARRTDGSKVEQHSAICALATHACIENDA